MPQIIDSIQELLNLDGLWEVIGFGQVRQATRFAQETEIEIFLSQPDLASKSRFTASSEIVSRYVGCGQLDLVTVGSRWRGGFFEHQVDCSTVHDGLASFVKYRQVGPSTSPATGDFHPTNPYANAPAYLIKIESATGKRVAIVPVMEVMRHVFGISSGFLRQLLDGIRDEALFPNRPVIDRKASFVADDVCNLRAKTPLRGDEAELIAATLADPKLLRSHDSVSNGLRTNGHWRTGLPAYVQMSFPFGEPLRWRFHGRWVCVPDLTKKDGFAWRLLVTRILDIDYQPRISFVNLRSPRKQPNPLAKQSPRKQRKGASIAAAVQMSRFPAKGKAPTVVVSPRARFIKSRQIVIDRRPLDEPFVAQVPPLIVGRSPKTDGATSDPQPRGDRGVKPIQIVRGAASPDSDALSRQSQEKTFAAICAVAGRRSWEVTDPFGTPISEMYCCPIAVNGRVKFHSLAIGIQTEHGHVLVMDAGSHQQARRSLGVILQESCSAMDRTDFEAVRTFAARSRGHWRASASARPDGMTITAYDRPPEVWESVDRYSALIGSWVDASIGGAPRLF